MANITKFSKTIAGTMTWGRWGKQLGKDEMIRLIKHCLEVGITTFDHADIYGGYTTEAEFGNAFSKSGIPRDAIQLISKCGIQLISDNRTSIVQHYNYSKEHITKSVEHSLKQLNTEYLDLLLLHRPSPLMDPDEINEAIMRLFKEGKILDYGVSNFTPTQIAMLEGVLPLSANQMEFSLTNNSVMYNGVLDDCVAHKRLAMSWSPLGGYFKEDNKKTQRIRLALEPMIEKYNATGDQLLLAWIMKHPAHIHPVVGTTNEDRLTLASKVEDIIMDIEDWFILLEASHGHPVP
ncbi:aldo/keto reductase [Maribacter sp. ANRC-HE7]|uniref:Aldo/keto reductase n=1 Tax=Maribacter aquimaris TaxID=2737171 RepID=A0ABR7V706_9FLAO|nr:aldo/keto reductase [Maribacter aquimaris]MBD0779431.1 aldo/keto reductase [Maribacter aquimaris]